MERDPVCGMTVHPAKAAAQVEHAGQIYYFCATGCAQRFSGNPDQYIGRAASGTSQATPSPVDQPAAVSETPSAPRKTESKVRYTCPMHPEVIRYGPGSCPKCGMALEPMDAAATAEDQPADPEYLSMRNRFWVSVVLSALIMLLDMAGEPLGLRLSGSARNWIEFALSAPVVLWGGWPFFERFAASLANRSPNMFTLIGLGTGAAFLDSVVATVFPRLFPESFRVEDGSVPVYF